MKRDRRHGRLSHSRARAVAGGSNVGRCPIYRLPPCRRPRKLCGQPEIRVRFTESARNGAARWAEKRWLCWGLSYLLEELPYFLEERRHVGGEGGGYGSMRAVGAVGVSCAGR